MSNALLELGLWIVFSGVFLSLLIVGGYLRFAKTENLFLKYQDFNLKFLRRNISATHAEASITHLRKLGGILIGLSVLLFILANLIF